ncbi:MAG: hypothetical protein AB1750_01490 [Chloroflexota bacterium]
MLRKFACRFDDMALALAVWMCALPLTGLIVLPLFGVKIGLLTAAGLLVGVLAICWGVCSWTRSVFQS